MGDHLRLRLLMDGTVTMTANAHFAAVDGALEMDNDLRLDCGWMPMAVSIQPGC